MITSEGPAPGTAIVVAGEAEDRMLLRSLLRLSHYRVAGEAEGQGEALGLLRHHRPAVMVVDLHVAEGSWPSLIAGARAILPDMKVILVAPASSPPTDRVDREQRPDAILIRPFRIRQFAEALLSVGTVADPGPG